MAARCGRCGRCGGSCGRASYRARCHRRAAPLSSARLGGGLGLSLPREPADDAAAPHAIASAMEHLIETVRRYPCLWNTTAIEYRDQELKDAAWAEVMKETDLSSVKEVKLKWKKLRDSYRDALKRQIDLLAREPGSGAGGGALSKRNYPWKYMQHMHFLQPYMSNRKKQLEAAAIVAAAAAAAGDTPRNGHALNGAASAAAEPASDSDSESEDEGTPAPAATPAPAPRPRWRSAGTDANRLGLIDRKLDYLCQERSTRPRNGAETQMCSRRRRATSPPPAPPPPPDPLDIFFNGMCQTTKRLPFHTQIKIKRTLFEAVTAAEEALLAEQQCYASMWEGGGGGGGAGTSSASSEQDEKPAAT